MATDLADPPVQHPTDSPPTQTFDVALHILYSKRKKYTRRLYPETIEALHAATPG